MIDPGAVVTAEDAERDFSRVARLAEEKGRVCVFRNGRPKLLVIDLDTEPQVEMSEDEKFLVVTQRILREHMAAFEEHLYRYYNVQICHTVCRGKAPFH